MNLDAAALFDLVKLLIVAYCVFQLNKSDRNQRELYRRLRKVELNCARHHGDTFGEED